MKSFSAQVQGLPWPAKLYGYSLLGPVNNLGKFRWYCKTCCFLEESNTQRLNLSCVKVDNQLQPIAIGEIYGILGSLSQVESQRVIAKCIRRAAQIQQPVSLNFNI